MSTQIEVGALLKTETAYDKDMNITCDGQEVRVILHWDTHDGWDYTWLDMENRFIDTPEWAQKIEDEGDMSIGFFLDGLEAHTKAVTP
jgi:hypothetical protein